MAPSTSVRWYPNEWVWLGDHLAARMEAILMMKAEESESMCAASVMMAIEFEIQPPTNSRIMNMKQMPVIKTSLLSAALPFLSLSWNDLSSLRKQSLLLLFLPREPCEV